MRQTSCVASKDTCQHQTQALGRRTVVQPSQTVVCEYNKQSGMPKCAAAQQKHKGAWLNLMFTLAGAPAMPC